MLKKGQLLSLAKLERAGALQILVYLYQNSEKSEKTQITEIIKGVKAASETVMATIKHLALIELINEAHVKSFPRQHLVWLTPKGKIVAQHLSEVASALHLPEPQPSDIPK